MRPLNAKVKHDGITAAGLAAQEEREAIYTRDRGICQTCGKPVAYGEFQLAHRIAETKANIKRLGWDVINHPLNKRTTHPGRCNDAVNCGNNPVKCAEIVEKIEEER